MKKKTMKMICTAALTLTVGLVCLTGCGQGGQKAVLAETTEESVLPDGGTLVVSVNPEIEVEYDSQGHVTGITARNDDAMAIISQCEGLIGQPTRTAVTQLVTAIGEAGYFVEETSGGHRQITIEIEAGSAMPYEEFLDEVVLDVKECVSSNNWSSPIDVQGESDYGITDYVDTDYGPENDGVTDYNDTDYGPENDGVTDYNDTDYGPENDGVTDYNDTDYGPENDGVTDYNDTDYGPENDGVTDYNDTDYGPENDGVTDYNDTDYGPENDGVTDYNDTDDGASNYDDGTSNYDDGASNYDDGASNYDDGASNYDDGASNYDDGSSDYDED